MGRQPGVTVLVLLLQLLSVSSGTVYVRTGSDISYCGMKCPDPWGALELYRICGATDERLLENFCKDQYIKNHISSRLHLDTGSGCWTLTHAERSDSCVYNIYHYSSYEYVRSSTDIRVLDPVLISSISSNCSRLGEDIAVSVHYSGEESAVTWELEGARLPERYRLIDDNRTLIIPSVQRGDAQRRFRVTVTNPVSERTWDYWLSNDSSFQRLLEEASTRTIIIGVLCGVLGIVLGIIFVASYWKRKRPTVPPEAEALNGSSAITPNGVPASSQDVMVDITNNGLDHDLTSDASTGA